MGPDSHFEDIKNPKKKRSDTSDILENVSGIRIQDLQRV